jgi:hypothetical protein
MGVVSDCPLHVSQRGYQRTAIANLNSVDRHGLNLAVQLRHHLVPGLVLYESNQRELSSDNTQEDHPGRCESEGVFLWEELQSTPDPWDCSDDPYDQSNRHNQRLNRENRLVEQMRQTVHLV